uniref:RNase H type-1 domain-containing protein n=1 Tax=Rhizophagus irregularis (strain DAOM 181602 / DAOM 197198 / MUCL 43194) TaxID=747089 RepID=U9U3Z4_RHIID
MNGQTSTGTCIRRGHFSKATVIKVEVLTKKIEEASFRIITPTNLIKRRTITSTAAFNNEQKLITVDIPLIDHNIISRFITSPLLAHELCDINSTLQRENNNIFQIYTDDLLNLNCRNSGREVVMDARWIIKDHNLSFSCGVNYHPSSTRPELLAIMTALLAVPNNAEVEIYTDIRGHSGNRWNDMADKIVKQGKDAASCNNDRIIDIRLLCSFSFPLTFLPVWYNISIDRHIRSFTRLVADSLEEVQWSFNKYWSSYFEETFTTSRWH